MPAKLCRRPKERPARKLFAGSSRLLSAEPSPRGGRVKFKTRILIETELFFYSPKKITKFEAESGARTNAKSKKVVWVVRGFEGPLKRVIRIRSLNILMILSYLIRKYPLVLISLK